MKANPQSFGANPWSRLDSRYFPPCEAWRNLTSRDRFFRALRIAVGIAVVSMFGGFEYVTITRMLPEQPAFAIFTMLYLAGMAWAIGSMFIWRRTFPTSSSQTPVVE